MVWLREILNNRFHFCSASFFSGGQGSDSALVKVTSQVGIPLRARGIGRSLLCKVSVSVNNGKGTSAALPTLSHAHTVSRALSRVHTVSCALSRAHTVSRALSRAHTVSRALSRAHMPLSLHPTQTPSNLPLHMLAMGTGEPARPPCPTCSGSSSLLLLLGLSPLHSPTLKLANGIGTSTPLSLRQLHPATSLHSPIHHLLGLPALTLLGRPSKSVRLLLTGKTMFVVR